MNVLLILPDATANDLAMFLANITPKQTDEAARKCAALYGIPEIECSRRLSEAAIAYRNEFRQAAFRPFVDSDEVRQRFLGECG